MVLSVKTIKRCQQVICRGVQQTGYASKTDLVPVSIAQGAIISELQQILGHLHYPFARNAGAQQNGQQVCITECPGAPRKLLLARLGF
jgi:hypothetical protein